MDTQEEIARLLAMQVRSQYESQTEAIRDFSKAGFGPSRIAELIGTTPGTVTVSLAKSKRSSAKRAQTTKAA